MSRIAVTLLLWLLVYPALAKTELEVPSAEPTCDGRLVVVANVDQLRGAVEDLNAGDINPGSVIRLLAGNYRLSADGPAIVIRGVQGSERCPVVIEGSGAGTWLDGGRTPLVNYIASRAGFPEEPSVNCLVLRESSWVVLKNLHIDHCWPTFLYVNDSSYLTLRNMRVTGSTYAVFLRGSTHHVLVEESEWEQDPSGDLWSTIPWGITHHGSRQHLNGAFVGATSIPGGVIIRRNRFHNAYNAVRLKSVDCPQTKRCNMNVEVYENTMEYIRDNPIEIEHFAANWWVHGNRIRNAHAWFSMDGALGGPHFIFSNVGWFDDVPGRRCRDEEWDNEKGADGTPFEERECGRSRGGRVLKMGNRMARPIYVFHNSWYLRAPTGGGGASGPVRFWNNAIEYCRPTPSDEFCTPVTPFYRSKDADRFVWNVDSTTVEHRMSYTLSNAEGFPQEFRAAGYPIHGFFAINLRFSNPAVGDFRLEADSPARNRGCLVYPIGDLRLTCTTMPYNWSPDIGAYQGDRLYLGPAYTHFDGGGGPDSSYVEPPRIVRLSLEALDQGIFSLQFSVPIELSSGMLDTHVMLERTESKPASVPCMIDIEDRSLLVCGLAVIPLAESAVTKVLLPRGIRRRDGAKAAMTLWGSPTPLLGVQP